MTSLGGVVLPRVLVECLVEPSDQLLEDVPHVMVGDAVGVQIDRPKSLHDKKQQSALVDEALGLAGPNLMKR